MRRSKLQADAARLARLIAEDQRNECLIAELRRIESELTSLAADPSVQHPRQRPGHWLLAKLQTLRDHLRGDCEKAKSVLSASLRDGIRIAPDVGGYKT